MNGSPPDTKKPLSANFTHAKLSYNLTKAIILQTIVLSA